MISLNLPIEFRAPAALLAAVGDIGFDGSVLTLCGTLTLIDSNCRDGFHSVNQFDTVCHQREAHDSIRKVEVVPDTLCGVVAVGQLTVLDKALEPLFVTQETDGAIILRATIARNLNDTTHEGSLVHVEGCGKDAYILRSQVLGGQENEDVVEVRQGRNAHEVVVTGCRHRQTTGNGLFLLDVVGEGTLIDVGLASLGSLQVTVDKQRICKPTGVRNGEQVLRALALCTNHRGVQGADDLRNHVVDAFPRGKGAANQVVGDRDLDTLLKVDTVIAGVDTRRFDTKLVVIIGGITCMPVRNIQGIRVNLLNRITILAHVTVCQGVGILVLRVTDRTGYDRIQNSVHVLVELRVVTHDSFAELLRVFGGRLRNQCREGKRHIAICCLGSGETLSGGLGQCHLITFLKVFHRYRLHLHRCRSRCYRR
nr:MAG TPA: hypothetical protein [Bacteriophage sp.]